MLIIGRSSGLRKTNALLNVIEEQDSENIF